MGDTPYRAAVHRSGRRFMPRASARRGPLDTSRLGAALNAALGEEAAYGHGFLWLAASFAAGAAFWRSLDAEPRLWLACAIFAVLCMGLTILKSRARFLLMLLASFAGGVAAGTVEMRLNGLTVLDSPVVTTVSGTVLGREIDDSGDWRYFIAVSQTSDPELRRPPDTVRILARSDHESIAIGDTITGLARLSPPSGPALPGSFDFAFNAYGQGIGGYGFFYGPPTPGNPDRPAVGLLDGAKRWVDRLRETIAFRIRSVVPGDAGAVAAAMTVSDRRAISEDTIEAFRVTGLAHILSISGLHMSLAAGIMFASLRAGFALMPGLAQAFPVKKLAALGALISSTFYLLLSGLVISAERAWIMVAIMLVAVLFDKSALTLRNVAIAGFIILIISPSAIAAPGFQMSFAATAALVASYGAWSRRSPRDDAPPDLFWSGWTGRLVIVLFGMAITAVIAGAATGIFAAHHFHRLSALGVVANVLAMPVISFLVMPLATFSLIAMPFGLDAVPLMALGMALDLVIAIAVLVAEHGGDVATGQVPLPATLCLSLALLIAVFTRTWLRAAAFVPLIAGFGVIAFQAVPSSSILIAEDGRLVGLVEAARAMEGDQTEAGLSISTNRPRPSRFIFDQWESALRTSGHVAPENLDILVPELSSDGEAMIDDAEAYRTMATADAERTALKDDSSPAKFLCVDGAFCLATTTDGVRVATVDHPAFLGPACDDNDVVVSMRRVDMEVCRSGALFVTPGALRETGAMTITLSDTGPDGIAGQQSSFLSINTALAGTVRPWTKHRYYDWRTRTFTNPKAVTTTWPIRRISRDDTWAGPTSHQTAFSERASDSGE